MTLSEEQDAQGGLEQTSRVDRIASLTGIRAVAALLVVGTHAAYTTGKYTHGYWGLVGSRMEIGVPIFFVLSGYLLFRPWVKSAARSGPPPSLSRYAWHRVRRIMPAYVITVLFAYVLYHFRDAGPNPGHSWLGLARNLTLTQIYCNGYLGKYLHQGLTQMWSLAVEASFYVVLPLLAYLLLVLICRRQWQPKLVLGALAGMALISPAWLVLVHTDHWFPDGARLWLPTYLAWFLAGMMLTVLQEMGVRGYGFVAIPLAVICLFHRVHSHCRRAHDFPGDAERGVVQDVLLCRHRRTRGGTAGPGWPIKAGIRECWPAARWCGWGRSPTRSS